MHTPLSRAAQLWQPGVWDGDTATPVYCKQWVSDWASEAPQRRHAQCIRVKKKRACSLCFFCLCFCDGASQSVAAIAVFGTDAATSFFFNASSSHFHDMFYGGDRAYSFFPSSSPLSRLPVDAHELEVCFGWMLGLRRVPKSGTICSQRKTGACACLVNQRLWLRSQADAVAISIGVFSLRFENYPLDTTLRLSPVPSLWRC